MKRVVVGSVSLGFILLGMDNLVFEDSLLRSTYGGGERKEELLVTEQESMQEKNFEVHISEQQYTKEQVEELESKVWEDVLYEIKGEANTFEKMTEVIVLPEKIEPYPIDIKWSWEPKEVLNSKGEVQEEFVDDTGCVVLLEAVLTYREYEFIHQQGIHVEKKELTEAEKWWQSLEQEVAKANTEDVEKETLTLPMEVDGVQVIWGKEFEYRGLYIMALGIFTTVLLLYKKKQEIEQVEQMKREEMERDYPQIISVFLLYMGAGMTTKNAWEQLVISYQEKGVYRHVYNEMAKTYQEMLNGKCEEEAYQDFGDRVDILVYRKFTLLVIQNIKKGTKGIVGILEGEAQEAFAVRKRRAQSLGEAAGTKLLLPMFLMLGVVLCIVIVPAFLSVQL